MSGRVLPFFRVGIPTRTVGIPLITRCINTQLGHQLIAGSVQLMEQPWMAQAHL